MNVVDRDRPAMRSGGQVLVDHLVAYGTEHVFCVPGESFLGALDALRGAASAIRLITCRHESGAANMAEAVGKLTGRPGVCFVTRGPGASHGMIGLHTARQDSTPMVMFIGQVGRRALGREAFQEIDYRRAFGEVAKHVEQVDDARRIPEIVARAFAIAMAGRRGPVVVVLPEDVLVEAVSVADVPMPPVSEPCPALADLSRVRQRLQEARRPLLIVGGSGWSQQARTDLVRFAEAFSLPVVAAFRCQDRIDNLHRLYVGALGSSVASSLSGIVQDADLLLVVGDRLGDMSTSGYTLVEAPLPHQAIIHVHPGAEELGRVHRTEIAINSAAMTFLAQMAAGPGPSAPVGWEPWAAAARKSYETELFSTRSRPGPLDLDAVMATMRRVLSPDAILTSGAGNYTAWPQRRYVFRAFPSQIAPTSGAMGYGVPAALAAKAVFPERQVIGFAGDGCFMMSVAEIATAVQYNLAPVIVILDNGMLGTIRMHQEQRYPGKVYGTDIVNPDFAELARAFGAHGETVRSTEEFEPAFMRALEAGKVALIHVMVDPEIISIGRTLSEIMDRTAYTLEP